MEWMNLGETAELLGVHPSTVRNWADQGKLPVHRTPGGHRRFRRDEIEFWMQANHATSLDESELVIRTALRQTRFRIGEGQLEQESWYQKLDENARHQYRLSGRSLLQSLRAYLSSDDGASGQAEARSLGYEYAVRAHRADLNIIEATQAFLFFRNNLLEAMYEVYEAAAVRSPAVWSDMFRRITDFMDGVMLALLEIHTAFQNQNNR